MDLSGVPPADAEFVLPNTPAGEADFPAEAGEPWRDAVDARERAARLLIKITHWQEDEANPPLPPSSD